MNQPTRRPARPAIAYRPAPTPYTGDGMECVQNLAGIPKQRLLDVAAWHDRRSGKRSVMIARALREAAGR
jgi:hypothetical protein